MKNKKDMTNNDMQEPVENSSFSENDQDVETAREQQPSSAETGEVEKLKAELEEQKDKYVRLFAEFDNYRRRTSKENIEIRQTAASDLITSLLEVLDDVDRAEQQIQESEENNAIKEGVLLVFNKFRRILQSKGLKPIETLHSDFDVEKDEAISEMPVEDALKGKVVAEVQKGYMLNDKLIRYAKVVVGK
jgi:molecular chaperone GrpE